MNAAQRQKLLSRLLFIGLIPLLALIATMAMPLVLIFQALDYVRLRYYCWKHGVWTFFVSNRRRGWHEFVDNNVRPILPEEIPLVWTCDIVLRESPMRWLYAAEAGLMKPCLVRVRWFGAEVRSIHARLKDFKWRRRVDLGLQDELARIVREEAEQLR